MNASISTRPARSAASNASLDLGRAPRQRLLAQHVLARLERLDRPRHVHRVRQRDVDRVDVGVGQQRLVGAVRRARSRARAANASPRARSREPTATTSTPVASRAPARTASLMRAVESTPHRTAPASGGMSPGTYPQGDRPLGDPPSCSSARRAPAPGDRVDRHGQQQHAAGEHELRARRQPEQAEAVVDRDASPARRGSRPSSCRDRRTATCRRSPRRRSSTAATWPPPVLVSTERRREARMMPPITAMNEQSAKHAILTRVDVDAGAPRRLGVAADRVDVAAEARAVEDERPEHEEQAADHERDVREPAVLVADRDHDRPAPRASAGDAQRRRSRIGSVAQARPAGAATARVSWIAAYSTMHDDRQDPRQPPAP